jgi:hypothetical protein
MFCIAAFILLAIMGIFSATHRELAKEAIRCVFKRVTLSACDSDFSTKVKSGLVNWLMKKNMKLASLFHRHSEAFAWVFVIISLVSLIYTSYGLYNYVTHGSCTPENPGQCTLTKISWLEQVRILLFEQ